MKKIIFSVLAFAAVLVSCQKNDTVTMAPAQQDAERVDLVVGVKGGAISTRATGIVGDATDEEKVNTLEVFVFNKDNKELDAYGKVENATEITVSCTAGERVIYAVVNAEDDLTAIATIDQLLAVVSDLKDNEVAGFEMIGSVEKSLPQADKIVIDVNRFAARVVLGEVVRNFTSSALEALEFSVDAVYLTNVATQMDYGYTMENTVWYNQFDVANGLPFVSEFAALTYDGLASPAVLAEEASYATAHYLYAYPNPHYNGELDGENEVNGETRLVVETTLNGTKYYYPIALPALESNKSYEVSKLTITRPGSLSPDDEISIVEAQFEVNVVDWTTVLLGDNADGIVEI